ncbi:sulfotransferase family protein [Methylobacterium trifolii]|uniref:Sulfotransferase domain-containing protein n=1 Tax=Methylobacterium trifolii TaxID=1003092 RepID=A0ABQ4U695_9HYPH|nr:sulfotransferase [Methylobacterium trifolii]GJE61898.1 hypothetical protein MPOCJGCO_4025 [Methylobacterium trifolii]
MSDLRTLHQFDEARWTRVQTVNRDAFPIPRRARDEQAFLRSFFQIVSGKTDLVAVGDKTPNIYDANAVQALRVALGGLKVITIVRNPVDVIASSMRRMVQTQAGGDGWHVTSIHDAIIEWINNWEYLASEFRLGSPDDIFVRYEDLAADYHGEMARIAAFLGVENTFEDLFDQTPEALRDYRLPALDRREVETRLGELVTGWMSKSLSEHLSQTPNVVAPVRSGEIIACNKPETTRYILRKGFGAVEGWGCWTHGTHAEIRFRIEGAKADAKVWIELSYIAWPGDRGSVDFAIKPKDGAIYVVNKVVDAGRPHERSDFVCDAPDGVVEFEIFIPRPKRSDQEPLAENRPLGIGLMSIKPTLV